MKVCPNCKIVKPLTEEYFYKTKYSKNGFSSWCKECKLQYQKSHNKKNAERQSEYIKSYYPSNKEKFSYKFKDKEKFNNYQKEYRKSEQGKLIHKKHRLLRNQHKKHEINIEEWDACRLYFDYRCAYCGLKYEEHFRIFRGKRQNIDLHKEHVDHNGANDLSNCIPSCQSCNSSKHDKEFSDWYNEQNHVFTHERLNRINEWLQIDYNKYIKSK